MFKNLTAFRIADNQTRRLLNDDDIEDTLDLYASKAPDKTSWRRFGFGHPSVFGETAVFDNGTGVRVFYVQQQERVLPGKVINQHLAARVAKLEQMENRKAGRKEIAQMKDSVIAELLPHAFIKATGTMVLIVGDWLLIDTGSTKLVDEIIGFLRTAFRGPDDYAGPVGELNLRLLCSASGKDIPAWLKSIATGDTDDDSFRHLDAVVLKGKGSSGGTARFKDIDFDEDEVQEALASGKRVIELAVSFWPDPEDGERINCAITENLVVKRIKYADIVVNQAEQDSDNESPVAHFDATIAIVSKLLVDLVEQIEREVGNKIEEDDEL